MTTLPDIDQYSILARPCSLIYIEDLYASYTLICQAKGITPITFNQLINYLQSIYCGENGGRRVKVINCARVGGVPCTHSTNGIHCEAKECPVILRIKYDRIRFIDRTYERCRQNNVAAINVYDSNAPLTWTPSNQVICMTVLSTLELLLITQSVLSRYHEYSAFLLAAKSGAIIILLNTSFLLIHASGVFKHMDSVLTHKLASNASTALHKWFAAKIAIGTILHIVGHLWHLSNVIQLCGKGCTHSDVLVVPAQTELQSISWSYFFEQLAYYTGVILTILLIAIALSVLAVRFNFVRASLFYNIHRMITVLFAIAIVVHGVEQLLGFNLAYVSVVPALICYLASRYTELSCQYQVEILDWHITDSTMRVCLYNTDRLARQLEYGVSLAAYIKHDKTSRFEWHPFTISNGISKKESYISIKLAGVWTKRFAENVLHSNQPELITIGHTVPSCFRFYRHYQNKIFFCSGIGITPFLSILDDPFEYIQNNVLVWSVGSVELLKEFGSVLCKLQTTPNLQILIFYSNSANSIDKFIEPQHWTRFNFLQTLVHYNTKIDILHGVQIPNIAMLERANPWNIISQQIACASSDTKTMGIFVCGGLKYTKMVEKITRGLRRNVKKIKLDFWAEDL